MLGVAFWIIGVCLGIGSFGLWCYTNEKEDEVLEYVKVENKNNINDDYLK